MKKQLTLNVNGQVYEIEVEANRLLLQVLRDTLGLTGTKEGCAEGDCGACTVAVGELHDGSVRYRSFNSCIQFLPTLDGKQLITVEDLARNGVLHPVQQAMVDLHGSQCGFCTPGFVMSLFTLFQDRLDQAPTRAEIDRGLAGNLCRCTGYTKIIEAVQQASGILRRRKPKKKAAA